MLIRTLVQEEAAKKHRKEHRQTGYEVSNSGLLEQDGYHQTQACRHQVKQDHDEQALEHGRVVWVEPNHVVHDGAKEKGRNHAQGKYVKEHFGEKVGKWRVKTIGALPRKEYPFWRKKLTGHEKIAVYAGTLSDDHEPGSRKRMSQHTSSDVRLPKPKKARMKNREPIRF